MTDFPVAARKTVFNQNQSFILDVLFLSKDKGIVVNVKGESPYQLNDTYRGVTEVYGDSEFSVLKPSETLEYVKKVQDIANAHILHHQQILLSLRDF